jgi:hypothetical protein
MLVARLKPVPGGSMNTRSLVSSQVSGLSINGVSVFGPYSG